MKISAFMVKLALLCKKKPEDIFLGGGEVNSFLVFYACAEYEK